MAHCSEMIAQPSRIQGTCNMLSYFWEHIAPVSPLQHLLSSVASDDVNAVLFEVMKKKILSKLIFLDAQGEFLLEHLAICTE
jgi:hypothetical protein